MFRLSRWLCQGNVLVLIFDLYSMWRHYFAVTKDTITSCSLDLDVYALNAYLPGAMTVSIMTVSAMKASMMIAA
jgi:hypothetical protein